MPDHSDADVGNIVLLEHVNLQVPDQSLAILFYIVGLGLTRDPYFNVGWRNMWANAVSSNFNLPTRPAQVIQGHIGIVMPDLEALKERLRSVEKGLADTKFSWSMKLDHIAVTCPWGIVFTVTPPVQHLVTWHWGFRMWNSWLSQAGPQASPVFTIKCWARRRQRNPASKKR